MNEAQEAFAEGFSELLEAHGETFTFGNAEFQGTVSDVLPDDPRMLGSSTQHVEITVATIDLPTPLPARGDEVYRVEEGKFYKISHLPKRNITTRRTSFLASLT